MRLIITVYYSELAIRVCTSTWSFSHGGYFLLAAERKSYLTAASASDNK